MRTSAGTSSCWTRRRSRGSRHRGGGRDRRLPADRGRTCGAAAAARAPGRGRRADRPHRRGGRSCRRWRGWPSASRRSPLRAGWTTSWVSCWPTSSWRRRFASRSSIAPSLPDSWRRRGISPRSPERPGDRRHGRATSHRVWSPATGHEVVPEQLPPPPAPVAADGHVERRLWAATEGPTRHEVGGAGGEPDGHTISIRKVVWD